MTDIPAGEPIEFPLRTADEMAQDAWSAMQRQDWDAALSLWAVVQECFPDRIDAHVWPIRALWLSNRLDAAERLAVDVLARFPDNVDALAEYAWVATTGRDWEAALARWSAVRLRSPQRIDAQVWCAQALRMAGRLDEAEVMATAAVALVPDNVSARIEHLWTAIARGDWPVAASRMAAARQLLGNTAQVDPRLGWAEYRLRLQQAANDEGGVAAIEQAGAATPPSPASDDWAEPGVRDLMLCFESLGERCDLGLVQRYYGVEPLGLLRFTLTPLPGLMAALETRFETVGDEVDTTYRVGPDGEYLVVMQRYGFVFHTFVPDSELPDDATREQFFKQQRRRLLYLKRKIAADLEAAEKICVYMQPERLSDADIMALSEALRRYGPNSLLCVRPAEPGRPDGTVEMLSDGLYLGYLGRFADFLAGETPPYESWREICTKTYRLSNWQRSQPAAAATGG